MKSAVDKTIDSFICSACSELLFEPIPLPCGSCVCSRCFRFPSKTAQSSSGSKNNLGELQPLDRPLPPNCGEECQKAVLAVGAYTCPSKDCKLIHRYRNESQHTLLNNLLRKLFPVQQQALLLAKQGEDLLKKYRASTEEGKKIQYHLLSDLLLEYLNPSISLCPCLQLPYILRSKVLAEMGHYNEARVDSKQAHEVNPINKRGVVSEKFVEFVQQINDPDTINNENRCALKDMRKQLISACQGIAAQVCSSKSKATVTRCLQTAAASLKIEELDCHLCLDYLVDPITTPCGHTFCRNCLLSSRNHSKFCPLCRVALSPLGHFASRQADKSLILLLTNLFDRPSHTGMSIVPIFAPQWVPIYHQPLLFPSSSTSYHISETQHRVMIKRVIETKGIFGVMLPPCASNSVDVIYGTLVRITGFEPLLSCDIVETCDGNLPRYVVQVSGISRFRVDHIRKSEAGYYEGLVTRAEDIDFDNESWDPRNLENLVARSRTFVKSLVSSLPESAKAHFHSKHGQIPVDPSDLSYWLAEILPLNPYVLYQIMTLDNVCDRLQLVCSWIDATQARNNQ